MITTEDLRLYVKAKTAEESFLVECLTAANALIAAQYKVATVPAALLDNATKQVAGNLYRRRAADLERANLGDEPGAAPAMFRPALDPLTPARPLLAPWKNSIGIA